MVGGYDVVAANGMDLAMWMRFREGFEYGMVAHGPKLIAREGKRKMQAGRLATVMMMRGAK
jgi:hypothetical protein